MHSEGVKTTAPLVFALLATLLSMTPDASARTEPADPNYRRHFVGSSLFVLANLVPQSSPPAFYQLNYGYRLTSKDVVSVEAITWTYSAPLGIPYTTPTEPFPGTVRAYGVGGAYQRFIVEGLYAAIHAQPMRQTFRDPDGAKIQAGFQLFLTLRIGYHFELFSNRLFVEPSVACTYWPINTNLPASFLKEERRWPNYFLLEPGLHFGVKL